MNKNIITKAAAISTPIEAKYFIFVDAGAGSGCGISILLIINLIKNSLDFKFNSCIIIV
jgi:hypothetical protein